VLSRQQLILTENNIFSRPNEFWKEKQRRGDGSRFEK
jgi:hypothetical protein